MNYIANSFSPKMLSGKKNIVSFKTISEQQFNKQILHSKSIIGHEELAQMVGVEANRESISLQHGDTVYCVLAKANRLPENHSFIKDKDSLYYVKCKV